jgi:hypothetical protein
MTMRLAVRGVRLLLDMTRERCRREDAETGEERDERAMKEDRASEEKSMQGVRGAWQRVKDVPRSLNRFPTNRNEGEDAPEELALGFWGI